MQFIIELDGSIQWHKMPIRFCKGIFLEKFQFGAISKTFCLQIKKLWGVNKSSLITHIDKYVLVCYKSMEKTQTHEMTGDSYSWWAFRRQLKKIHRQKYKKGIFQPVENFFEIRVVELDLLPHVTSFISRSTDYPIDHYFV